MAGRSQQFSVFEYLYRDASNYKAWGALLLLGAATDANTEAIRRHLELGEYFIPGLLGIPSLDVELHQYSGGPTEDDHFFHEFVDLRAATKQETEALPLWGTLAALKARFRESRSRFQRHASTRFS